MSYDRPEHPDALDELTDPADVPGATQRRPSLSWRAVALAAFRRTYAVDFARSGGEVLFSAEAVR